jgi:hypothetical protein
VATIAVPGVLLPTGEVDAVQWVGAIARVLSGAVLPDWREDAVMLEQSQFDVNDAWVVFRLNSVPMSTEVDGDFNLLCMMDVASCYIFGNELVPVQSWDVSESAVARLIESGKSQVQSLPHRFLLSSEFELERFAAMAGQLGVEVQWVTDEELLPLVSETREIFRESFERGRSK